MSSWSALPAPHAEQSARFVKRLAADESAAVSGGLQLPVPSRVDLLPPRQHLLRRDVANGPIQTNFVVILAEGQDFFYSVLISEQSHTRIRIGSLELADAKALLEADSNAIYASGHLLYLRESNLTAQPFDPKRMTTTGDAVPIAEDLGRADFLGADPDRLSFSSDKSGLEHLRILHRLCERSQWRLVPGAELEVVNQRAPIRRGRRSSAAGRHGGG